MRVCGYLIGLMGLVVGIGCGGEDDTANSNEDGCVGDGCVVGDTSEPSVEVCETALEFAFAQGTTKVFVLSGTEDSAFGAADEVVLQVLNADTGQVVDEATSGVGQAAALVLEAATDLARVQTRVLGLKEGESQPVAMGTSAVYTPGVDSAYVWVHPQGSWSTGRSAATCEPTQVLHARFGHTVNLLHDGRILIVGGAKPPAIPSFPADDDLGELHTDLEVYDPATGVVLLLPGALPEGRVFHTATTLSDGTVLVAGGLTGDVGALNPVSSTVLIDPAADFFVDVTTVPMQRPRAKHAAIYSQKLDAVLLVGGAVGSAESDLWKSSGSIPIPTSQNRAFHTLSFVPETDTAIAIGGELGETVVNNAEYFQLSGSVQSGGVIPLPAAGERTLHGAAYLSSAQKVYIAGGFKDTKHTNASKDVLVWDPETNAVTYIPFQLNDKRGAPVVLPFASANLVLVAGGYTPDGALSSAEAIVVTEGGGGLGVPDAAVFPAPDMPMALFGAAATLEGTGRGFVTGGSRGDAAAQPILFLYTP